MTPVLQNLRAAWSPHTITAMSNIVAHVVKKKRKEKGLSLRDVAKLSHVSYQTVFSVEHGDGSDEAAMKVLMVLGVSLKERMRLLMASMRKLAAA